MLLGQVTSEAIRTGLDLDGAADVSAVRWIGEGGRERPSN
jgi:hypothetical protein